MNMQARGFCVRRFACHLVENSKMCWKTKRHARQRRCKLRLIYHAHAQMHWARLRAPARRLRSPSRDDCSLQTAASFSIGNACWDGWVKLSTRHSSPIRPTFRAIQLTVHLYTQRKNMSLFSVGLAHGGVDESTDVSPTGHQWPELQICSFRNPVWLMLTLLLCLASARLDIGSMRYFAAKQACEFTSLSRCACWAPPFLCGVHKRTRNAWWTSPWHPLVYHWLLDGCQW